MPVVAVEPGHTHRGRTADTRRNLVVGYIVVVVRKLNMGRRAVVVAVRWVYPIAVAAAGNEVQRGLGLDETRTRPD